MARENNFLLGHGERLTYKVNVPHSGGSKNPPYTHSDAIKRISRFLTSVNNYYNSLPESACPNEEVTAVITMHPRYISKSDFPTTIMQQVGLRAVGGKTQVIRPDAWGIENHPKEAISDEIYVIGKKSSYIKWANEVNNWKPNSTLSNQLPSIEKIRPYEENEKINMEISEGVDNDLVLLEVVLHDSESTNIFEPFLKYANKCNGVVVRERVKKVQNLIFIPVYIHKKDIMNLGKFSLIRVIRKMPLLRTMTPITRKQIGKSVKLPITAPAIDQNIRVGIFDGGISDDVKLPWVRKIECDGIGNAIPEAKNHGTDVTSAFLFGSIDPSDTIERPFCNVDNIRVIDKSIGQNGDFMYYDVLDRILKVIDDAKKSGNPYEYINLSIGPDIPADDNDITRWTVELDKRLSGGRMLACVAAGNNGEEDEDLQLNRIQPPSDGVNVLSVGAADREDGLWKRASYSCIGPGRCPGFIKPDGIAFGGTEMRPFLTISSNTSSDNYLVSGTMGTSFASPYTLHSATAVRAVIGDNFIPLSIKALMVHRAEQKGFDKREVGWGKFQTDISKLITCDDDEALIIFQGILPVKETLRVPVPIPADSLQGMVNITATLAIAPDVDASFPNTYTRAGLTVAFRPNCNKFNNNKGKPSNHPKTKSFFSESIFSNCSSEFILRTENHKWETCLRETKAFRASSLNKPCFDVYYNNRIEGGKDDKASSIPYAFIVSIKAPKVTDLYNRTVRSYLNQLVPLKPKIKYELKYKV